MNIFENLNKKMFMLTWKLKSIITKTEIVINRHFKPKKKNIYNIYK